MDAIAKNTLVPLLLRVGLAAVFIYHGMEKVRVDAGATWMNKMPDPQPAPVQMAVAWGELLGGIAVALGLLTRIAAAGLALIMVGAIVMVHGIQSFSLQEHGFEYNFVLILMCVSLILMGPGTASVDRFFRLQRKP